MIRDRTKPRAADRRLLDFFADLSTACDAAGIVGPAREKLYMDVATEVAAQLTGRRPPAPIRPVPDVRMGWRDGRWTRLEEAP